jgi:hypothetical protein
MPCRKHDKDYKRDPPSRELSMLSAEKRVILLWHDHWRRNCFARPAGCVLAVDPMAPRVGLHVA